MLFLRGDVDMSGSDEITDAINLLDFLFSGGPTPACMDAADANDTGIGLMLPAKHFCDRVVRR